MNYATIWAIDEIWTKLELALGQVESKALLATGLLTSLRETFFSKAERFTATDEQGNTLRRRFMAVLNMATRHGDELVAAIGSARGLMEERQRVFAEIARARDPGGVIREALDEALWILETAGTSPLILVFDREEAERLGDKPLAQLVEMLQRILDFVGMPETPSGMAGMELRAAVEAAVERARLLAEGAKHRQWNRPRKKRKGEGGESEIEPSEREEEELETIAPGEPGERARKMSEGEAAKAEGGSEGRHRGGRKGRAAADRMAELHEA